MNYLDTPNTLNYYSKLAHNINNSSRKKSITLKMLHKKMMQNGIVFEPLKSRKGELVQARYMFYKIAFDNKMASSTKIGDVFFQDHATALHGKKTFEKDF